MAKVKFCPICQKAVTPKKCNKLLLIILLIFLFVPGVIYWIVCGGNKCPICNTKL